MPLFERKNFISHAGLPLTWKVECLALSFEDWETLAFMIAEKVSFGAVEGVPTGGILLARALQRYVTTGPLLIVDDVCTTGGSLEVHRAGRDAIGFVIFARNPRCLPSWVQAVWRGFDE